MRVRGREREREREGGEGGRDTDESSCTVKLMFTLLATYLCNLQGATFELTWKSTLSYTTVGTKTTKMPAQL